MRNLLLSLFVIFCVNCTSIGLRQNHFKILKVNIEQKQDNIWRVTYELPVYVNQLTFKRQTNQFRKSEWLVKSSDLTIQQIDGKEIIKSKENKRFRKVVVEFSSYYDHTPKDYEFFQAFSDGGVIMYTGHLYFDGWTHNISVIPKRGERLVVMGKVSTEEFKWTDKEGKGTYVYFGRIVPIVTNRMIAVIDPGLPMWIQKSLHDFLPRLFDLYTSKTKEYLTFKPVVLFNYKQSKLQGTRSSGGTLPGLVQMTIEGKDWERQEKRLIEKIVWFFAHEAAHFWNGQMFDNLDNSAAWLHEGGADAFAYRSLFDFGMINKTKLWKMYENALNLCMLGLEGKALNSSANNRNFKNYYHCGSVIMLMVDSALKNKGAGDLDSFWQEVFSEAKKNNNKYDRKVFHKVLSKQFKMKDLSVIIDQLELKNNKNIVSVMSEMATLSSLEMKKKNMNASSEFLFHLNKNFLKEVVKKDCQGRYNISHQGKGFVVRGNDKCRVLKSKEYDVIGIEGIKLSSKSRLRPLVAASKVCKIKEQIKFDVYGGNHILLPCPDQVRLQSWFELSTR